MIPGSAMFGGRCSRSYQRFQSSTASASQSTDAKMIPETSTACSARSRSGGTQLDEAHERDLPIGAALVVVVPGPVGREPLPRLRVVGAVEHLSVGPEQTLLHADLHLGVRVAVAEVEVPRRVVGRAGERRHNDPVAL